MMLLHCRFAKATQVPNIHPCAFEWRWFVSHVYLCTPTPVHVKVYKINKIELQWVKLKGPSVKPMAANRLTCDRSWMKMSFLIYPYNHPDGGFSWTMLLSSFKIFPLANKDVAPIVGTSNPTTMSNPVNGEFKGWFGFLPLFPYMNQWFSMVIRLMSKLINLIRWKTKRFLGFPVIFPKFL